MESSKLKLDAKVMIVDDDPINIRNASRILKDDYRIVYALSAKAALEILEEESLEKESQEKEIPDLILLDIHMPQMNGFEMLEILQAKEEFKEIPVILLTADNDRETEARGLQSGALDFITKPFLDEIVKQRVRRLVELRHLQKKLQEEVERQTKKAEERRKQVEEMSFQTVHALADAIDAKDKYTNGHSARVAAYSVMLAKEIGWPGDKVEALHYAALLHDVGKIGVPDVVLNKPGKLTNIEFDIIKAHTTVGADILKNITTALDAQQVAAHHHERYSGDGYPSRLSGTGIPEMARIVGIADAYDAMSSKRVYRNCLPAAVIRGELVKGRGTQFDPDYLDAFLKMFDEDRLKIEDKAGFEGDCRLLESVENLRKMVQSFGESDAPANVDLLTSLPMRNEGERRIQEELANGSGFLAILDIDDLGKINELCGHKIGDELIKHLAALLLGLGDEFRAFRLGGDELALFGHVGKQQAYEILIKLQEDFEQEIRELHIDMECSLSAGATICLPTESVSDAMNHADKALYYAKQNGKRSLHFYEKLKNDALISDESVDLKSLIHTFRKKGEYAGALSVNYSEFAQLFEYVSNMEKRYAHKVQLMMITLHTDEMEPLYIERIEEAVKAMENSIRSTIRAVDICTRFSSLQFLIILMGTQEEEISGISERIFNGFFKSYGDWNIRLSYDADSISENA